MNFERIHLSLII